MVFVKEARSYHSYFFRLCVGKSTHRTQPTVNSCREISRLHNGVIESLLRGSYAREWGVHRHCVTIKFNLSCHWTLIFMSFRECLYLT